MPRSTAIKQTEAKTEQTEAKTEQKEAIDENEIVIDKVKKTKSRTKPEIKETKPEIKEEKKEENKDEEIWRDINVDDEAVKSYRISNYGRIQNKKTGLMLKIGISTTNRPTAKLGKLSKSFQVNTLVAKTFLEYPKVEENQIVHVTHIDGNPHNVRFDNLKIEIRNYNKVAKQKPKNSDEDDDENEDENESIYKTIKNREIHIDDFTGKEIEGYNNFLISRDGNVYSKISQRQIAILFNPHGYNRIALTKNTKTRKFYIHRLVAIAYIPNPENYEFVNHKDSNKHNNTVENLEWCSGSMNMKHNAIARNQGRRVIQYNEETGKEIAKFNTVKEASEATGTDKTSIIHCCAKRRAKANGFVWRYEGEEFVEKENKENSDSDD